MAKKIILGAVVASLAGLGGWYAMQQLPVATSGSLLTYVRITGCVGVAFLAFNTLLGWRKYGLRR